MPATSRVALRLSESNMANVLSVLCDDPVDGYPKTYARDRIPTLGRHPGVVDDANSQGDRLRTRPVAWQRLWQTGAAIVPGS